MTVQELINLLSQQPPDSQVTLMTQPRHPTESQVFGVVQRKQFQAEANADRNPEDVIVLEGTVAGWGAVTAWEVK